MVKNSIGGNKAKRIGRKFVGDPGASKRLRMPEDPDEIFAACAKMLGNGMFEAVCEDTETRLCYMPKKFKGRGKRDNNVALGTWVLVGKRSWECSTPAGRNKRLDKCDLLEVYNANETDRLKKLDINWSALLSVVDARGNNNEDDIGDILFTDDKTEQYNNLIITDGEKTLGEAKQWDSAPALLEPKSRKNSMDDEINIDDI